jgi:hypothetical protein
MSDVMIAIICLSVLIALIVAQVMLCCCHSCTVDNTNTQNEPLIVNIEK